MENKFTVLCCMHRLRLFVRYVLVLFVSCFFRIIAAILKRNHYFYGCLPVCFSLYNVLLTVWHNKSSFLILLPLYAPYFHDLVNRLQLTAHLTPIFAAQMITQVWVLKVASHLFRETVNFEDIRNGKSWNGWIWHCNRIRISGLCG